jgi:drug/metabolite transporter (DMT)-like permease
LSSSLKQTQTSSVLAGIGYAVSTALLFGAGTPLSKLLLDRTEPWLLVGLLFMGGGCGLLPIVLLRHYFLQPIDYIQPGEWRWVWSSTLAGGIAPIFLMVGLQAASASSVALLLNFEAVFTAILAWTVFRERWQWPVFFGIIPITIGGVLLSQASELGGGWSWGSLAVLGTCLCWAIDSNLTFQVAHRDPFQIALIKNAVAGVLNVAIASLIGQSLPSGPLLIKIGGVGFLCYGLTYCCFVLALRRIGPSRTAAFFALAPLMGSAVAVVVLKESVTLVFAIAALIMTGGALLCAWEPKKP